MILGDVEETVTTIEIDEETYEEIYKVRTKKGVNLSSLFFFFLIKLHCVILNYFIADCFLNQALTGFEQTVMKVYRVSRDLV